MESSVIRQIHRLREMTVGELRVEWQRLYGSTTTSSNRDHLWRRLAWRVQELAHGGLSDRAKQRLEGLGQDVLAEARGPNVARDVAVPAPVEKLPRPVRDLRMPTVGSVITKIYKGHELRVVVRDGGFEFDGSMFSSLSALARHVTGCRSINGKLFFGLTGRARRP